MAREAGLRTLLYKPALSGEARDEGQRFGLLAKNIVQAGTPLQKPCCVVAGGETTVTVTGRGRGGRAQEFVAAAALEIAGLAKVWVVGIGTDGTDGPTDAAGAIADGQTLGRKPEARLYLERNDSYNYFQPLGDLVITGPTNTNVMDVRLILVGSKK